MTLNVDKLKQCVPTNKKLSDLCETLNNILPVYGITSVNRIAAFLAQCGHESNDFNILSENLNYSASGLLSVFPKHFNEQTSQEYARQPERIANIVYANRMGNGDVTSGDGWKYRGRGAIQLTGKNNYIAFGKSINKSLAEIVDYCDTLNGAVESACYFWHVHNLNRFADAGEITEMSQVINGGSVGLNDRLTRYKHNLGVLS